MKTKAKRKVKAKPVHKGIPDQLSGKVYTTADCPKGYNPDLWRMAIDQGTVESSNGRHILTRRYNLFESDEEFDRFMKHMRSIRAEKS